VYNFSNLDELIQEFAIVPKVEKYFKVFPYDKLDISVNPKIKTRAILFSEVFTIGQMTLHDDPKQKNKENEFADNNLSYFWGDNTVNIYSLALAPLNWIADYLKLSKNQVIELLG
jgi:hypothetical protein